MLRRKRCGQKRQFADKKEAMAWAAMQSRRSGERWSHYYCQFCGYFHIGHTPGSLPE